MACLCDLFTSGCSLAALQQLVRTIAQSESYHTQGRINEHADQDRGHTKGDMVGIPGVEAHGQQGRRRPIPRQRCLSTAGGVTGGDGGKDSANMRLTLLH